jgi:hypothetical protein
MDVPCRPNISESGRRRRVRFGWMMVAGSVGLLVAVAALHPQWFWGLTLFVPVASAATGFLQVRRDTCVLRAKEGTFEHEDGHTTPAPPEEVSASRAVAHTIRRDAALIGLLGAAIGVAASFV